MEKYISFHGNVSLLIVLCIESGGGGKKEEKNLDILISETSLKNIWGVYSKNDISSVSFSIPKHIVTAKCHSFLCFIWGRGGGGWLKNDRLSSP